MRYKVDHLHYLLNEAEIRWQKLVEAITPKESFTPPSGCSMVSGSQVRMAVDDFKNILLEIRRLK